MDSALRRIEPIRGEHARRHHVGGDRCRTPSRLKDTAARRCLARGGCARSTGTPRCGSWCSPGRSRSVPRRRSADKLRRRSRPKAYRIGFVGLPSAGSLPERPEAFRAGLRNLGYQEGRNFVIEYRWAEERYERLPALFAELVRLNVDVIVTHGTPGALAAKGVTNTIPVVVAAIADAEASGVVASLAKPAGT